MSVEPETHAASTPTGMTVKVHIPQESTLSATGLAEADVKETTVALPEGVQASPGAANGLVACSAASVGFTGSQSEIGPRQNEAILAGRSELSGSGEDRHGEDQDAAAEKRTAGLGLPR